MAIDRLFGFFLWENMWLGTLVIEDSDDCKSWVDSKFDGISETRKHGGWILKVDIQKRKAIELEPDDNRLLVSNTQTKSVCLELRMKSSNSSPDVWSDLHSWWNLVMFCMFLQHKFSIFHASKHAKHVGSCHTRPGEHRENELARSTMFHGKNPKIHSKSPFSMSLFLCWPGRVSSQVPPSANGCPIGPGLPAVRALYVGRSPWRGVSSPPVASGPSPGEVL